MCQYFLGPVLCSSDCPRPIERIRKPPAQGVEVTRRDGLRIDLSKTHADPDIADREIVVPARALRAGREQFGNDAEGRDVKRGAFRGALLEALVVDVVQESHRAGARRDGRRLNTVSARRWMR